MTTNSPGPRGPRFLDYEQSARYLSLTRRQLERLVWGDKIGHVRLGRNTVFTTEQLDAYLASVTFTPGDPA